MRPCLPVVPTRSRYRGTKDSSYLAYGMFGDRELAGWLTWSDDSLLCLELISSVLCVGQILSRLWLSRHVYLLDYDHEDRLTPGKRHCNTPTQEKVKAEVTHRCCSEMVLRWSPSRRDIPCEATHHNPAQAY